MIILRSIIRLKIAKILVEEMKRIALRILKKKKRLKRQRIS